MKYNKKANNRLRPILSGLFILCLFLYSPSVQSQDFMEMMENPWGRTLEEIQTAADAHFAVIGTGRGTGYKQWKRWEYKMERRLHPSGKLVSPSKLNWKAYHNYAPLSNPSRSAITNGSWTEIGPDEYTAGSLSNIGLGRVNCFGFHPTLAATIYAGTPAGGLWRTTNTGGSWTPLTDGLPQIGISGIVVVSTNTLYILTGDGDGGDTDCIGVLKSINGGATWSATGLTFSITDNVRGYKLIGHPTNSNILFAVTNTGLFRTTNGGVSWTEVDTDSFRDIEFKPGDPTVVYASTNNNFYRSTDSGVTWTNITAGITLSGANRVAIGVTPGNVNYVYVLAGPGGSPGAGSFKGFWRSFDSGVNFDLKTTTPNILDGGTTGSGSGSQSSYDLAMAVDPTDVSDILTGGINIWESTNFGDNGTWSCITHWNPSAFEYTHADIHAMDYNPLDNVLYVGSDGGVYRSTDRGATYTDISNGDPGGMTMMQFYRIAGRKSTSGIIIGGTQDNGSNRYTSGNGSNFFHMRGADGMDCGIDPNNSNNMYSMTQNGGMAHSTNQGVNWSSITPAGATGAWVTPMVVHPTNGAIVYAGYNDVYYSTNSGSTWTNRGSDGRGAFAMGTSNTSKLYAANGSTLQMSTNAGVGWTTVSSNGLPGSTITFIAVNPDNSNDVFVTYGGYTDGQKVYRSTNSGTSWTNVSGTLPNVPVNCIAYEDNNGSPNDALYIGTDIGVFYRDDVLGDWVPFSNWLPVVPVFDLEINEVANLVRAGTHGRGLWTSSTYTSCQASWNLSNAAAPGYSYYQASDFITSSRTAGAGIGQELYFKAADRVILTTGFNVHCKIRSN